MHTNDGTSFSAARGAEAVGGGVASRSEPIRLRHTLEDITSVENLLAAWQEFLPGKRNKPDVQAFGLRLMDNVLALHHELAQGTYRHGPYTHFRISDPKPRDIHKATVRDRLVHHAILLRLLAERIPDARMLALLHEIISSFSWTAGVGLPLGNLTSQLFVNVYLTPFDQFVKHQLRAKCYVRYADDFAILSDDRAWLKSLVPQLANFLHEELRLSLHPRKVTIQTLASGVDFLGWVHFSNHRVLRTATKQRMFRHLRDHSEEATVQSYLGLLRHGDALWLCEQVRNVSWFQDTC